MSHAPSWTSPVAAVNLKFQGENNSRTPSCTIISIPQFCTECALVYTTLKQIYHAAKAGSLRLLFLCSRFLVVVDSGWVMCLAMR